MAKHQSRVANCGLSEAALARNSTMMGWSMAHRKGMEDSRQLSGICRQVSRMVAKSRCISSQVNSQSSPELPEEVALGLKQRTSKKEPARVGGCPRKEGCWDWEAGEEVGWRGWEVRE